MFHLVSLSDEPNAPEPFVTNLCSYQTELAYELIGIVQILIRVEEKQSTSLSWYDSHLIVL